MSVNLGGINLPDLLMSDRHTKGVISKVARALDDTAIIWEGAAKNHVFVLYSTISRATITKEQLDQLWALANTPNATYTLLYEGEGTMVRFMNEDWPPIEATPVSNRYDPVAGDRFHSVKIKLMEIK